MGLSLSLVREVPQSLVVEEFLRGSSPPKGLWLVTPGRGRTELLAATAQVSGGGSSFPMDRQFNLKGIAFPKAPAGSSGGRRRYVFSLLTLEDQATERQGGNQRSLRP